MKSCFSRTSPRLNVSLGLLTAAILTALPAQAQSAADRPITSGQRATAQRVASQGVPLSALAANAPDQYTVRSGDTLWGISGLFLKSPWRWPELWGMNLKSIRNPHLIYPGQKLYLERVGGRAFLRTSRSGDGAPSETIRVSPRTRVDVLGSGPLPTLQPHLIEPFLTESLIVDDESFERAPRIVALANKDRILVSKDDRAYVRGLEDAPLLKAPGLPTDFRVFRSAVPLKDPITEEILGYEAQYVGRANLVRGESEVDEELASGRSNDAKAPPEMPESGDSKPLMTAEEQQPTAPERKMMPVPATVDVVNSKEEMRPGDRLIPEPPRDFRSYVPHAPDIPIDARVVKVQGDAVRYAGQNQVVILNKGLRDGVENGHVLALLTTGSQMVDKTDDSRARIQLPDERNGLALVFRPFERTSYALVMEITSPVQVGDKLINPTGN
ncbi:LysM peptidoglycan-binding domain-containing protein [Ottowia sp.]|uniref:LysM peptidoglycan-binding domain-containing protein n=1 Tax=Ottowia sp. TaxID=1898956 RepID=UPI003A8A6695